MNIFTHCCEKVNQVIDFWCSVLFGPDRAMSEIRKSPDFESVVEQIRAWLSDLFDTQEDVWTVPKASRNPYSETLIFVQEEFSEIPQRLFVKRFIVQLENNRVVFPKGFEQETRALEEIACLNGRYQVTVPKLYGRNLDLCLMATSYHEGNQFFNTLFQSPIKFAVGKARIEDAIESLWRLGQWLRDFHSFGSVEGVKGKNVKTVLDKDIAGIEERVYHLRKVRPADFSSGLCEKVIFKAHKLRERILGSCQSLVTIHGDFSLVNVLYDSQKLTVLDFTYYGVGFAEDDLARMHLDLSNIESYSFMLSPTKRGSLCKAFFRGYGWETSEKRTASYEFFLIKHSVINIYMYTKHWGNKTFLNPVLCLLLYHYQKRVLCNIIEEKVAGEEGGEIAGV